MDGLYFMLGFLIGEIIFMVCLVIYANIKNIIDERRYREYREKEKNHNIYNEDGEVIWNGLKGCCGPATYIKEK